MEIFEKGISQGILQGQQETFIELVHSGILTEEVAAECNFA